MLAASHLIEYVSFLHVRPMKGCNKNWKAWKTPRPDLQVLRQPTRHLRPVSQHPHHLLPARARLLSPAHPRNHQKGLILWRSHLLHRLKGRSWLACGGCVKWNPAVSVRYHRRCISDGKLLTKLKEKLWLRSLRKPTGPRIEKGLGISLKPQNDMHLNSLALNCHMSVLPLASSDLSRTLELASGLVHPKDHQDHHEMQQAQQTEEKGMVHKGAYAEEASMVLAPKLMFENV